MLLILATLHTMLHTSGHIASRSFCSVSMLLSNALCSKAAATQLLLASRSAKILATSPLRTCTYPCTLDCQWHPYKTQQTTQKMCTLLPHGTPRSLSWWSGGLQATVNLVRSATRYNLWLTQSFCVQDGIPGAVWIQRGQLLLC